MVLVVVLLLVVLLCGLAGRVVVVTGVAGGGAGGCCWCCFCGGWRAAALPVQGVGRRAGVRVVVGNGWRRRWRRG